MYSMSAWVLEDVLIWGAPRICTYSFKHTDYHVIQGNKHTHNKVKIWGACAPWPPCSSTYGQVMDIYPMSC